MTEKEFNNAIRLIAINAYKGNRVTQQLALEFALREALTLFKEYIKDNTDGIKEENNETSESPKRKSNANARNGSNAEVVQ